MNPADFGPEFYADEAYLWTEEGLRSSLIFEDDHFYVFNKPGWLVCHPSKNGPWSSLVGAAKESFQAETLHLIARLDRETSGLIILAKHRASARRSQMALEHRRARKHYLAVVEGEMASPVEVNQPIARDFDSEVAVKQIVRVDRTSQSAETLFEPLHTANGHTLVRVSPHTGRKHQIRVHALWLGHRIVGDKIYGHDESLYLEFINDGWTPRLREKLAHPRHALHAFFLHLWDEPSGWKQTFRAPPTEDFLLLCHNLLNLNAGQVMELAEKGLPPTPEDAPAVERERRERGQRPMSEEPEAFT